MDLGIGGRVILVVGGHGLIGSAVVAQLRAEGAVAIPASRRPRDGIVLDAANDESVTSALAAVRATHGRLDGLVMTAAPSARTLDPTRSSDPLQVLKAVDEKVMTFLRVINAVLPQMTEAGYGRVVGISGQNAFLTGNITGSVRNAAFIIAAKNLADAVAGTGVTVNAVNPSAVSSEPSAEVEAGRPGECSPQDVASIVTYLVSPSAGAISGESIAVGHKFRGATGL